MLVVVPVATCTDFDVGAVTCRNEDTCWSAPEVCREFRVVLVRRGRFRRCVGGIATEIDSTIAYLGAPGDEESFAHPTGGDLCTAISVTPELWRSLAGDDARASRQALFVDPRLDLAHRRLLAAARSDDVDFAVAEELLVLLAAAIEQTVRRPTPLADVAGGPTRRLVTAARQAIAEGDPASDSLFSLAELLGVSPYRLSRAFPRELGVSVTHYRQRIRLGHALDRLEEGEGDLGLLAADLGYADQAHLTRTMRRHMGFTPAALRRLLAPRKM